MRIGIVANTTWNVYNFRLNVVRVLIELGHTIFVIAPVDEFIFYKEQFPGVKHIPLTHLSRDGINPVKDLRLLVELRMIYKKLKLDRVLHYTHKPNLYGTIAARSLGIRSLMVVTGLGYSFINRGFVNVVSRNLYRIIGRWSAEFIFENEDDRAEFRRLRILDKDQGQVLNGCGVNLEEHRPSDNGIYADELVFTFIGRLLRDKGIIEYVQAARAIRQEIPKSKFLIAGELDEGNPSTVSKKLLAEWVNEGVVEYLGFRKNIAKVIDQSHCIVLPSYREGMSRVLMEALAHARPVITTDVPGCRQTVNNGLNGLLVPPRDAAALKEAMSQFAAKSFQEQIEMGQSGRLIAEAHFSDDAVAEQLVNFLL